jgi:hypothetical protein
MLPILGASCPFLLLRTEFPYCLPLPDTVTILPRWIIHMEGTCVVDNAASIHAAHSTYQRRNPCGETSSGVVMGERKEGLYEGRVEHVQWAMLVTRNFLWRGSLLELLLGMDVAFLAFIEAGAPCRLCIHGGVGEAGTGCPPN